MPNSINNYSLVDDGRLKFELAKPCYVWSNYLVYYDKIIIGKVRYRKITNFSGIQVKQCFIWVVITGMELDLPTSNFI